MDAVATKRRIRDVHVMAVGRSTSQALAIARKAVQKVMEGKGRVQGTASGAVHIYRDPKTGQIKRITHETKSGNVHSLEPVVVRDSKGRVVTLYRDVHSGSFTSVQSANRIRETSVRAAESLRRLAKR